MSRAEAIKKAHTQWMVGKSLAPIRFEEQENGLVIRMIEVFRHLLMPRHFTIICEDTGVSNKNRTLVVQYSISKASNMVVVMLSFLSSYVNLKKFGGDTPYSSDCWMCGEDKCCAPGAIKDLCRNLYFASSLKNISVAFARAGCNAGFYGIWIFQEQDCIDAEIFELAILLPILDAVNLDPNVCLIFVLYKFKLFRVNFSNLHDLFYEWRKP